jgi:sulfur relay (sulfurtransferase) complex TusBCD TusD component (DsrE family)
MKFTLTINSDSGHHAPARRALGFLRATRKTGHDVSQVFFYGDGVRSLLESSIAEQWRNEAHGIELILCSASADRFGIDTPPEGFDIAGLGALVESGCASERVINFV